MLANGMPHCIINLQKPCPLQRIMQAEGDEHPLRPGEQGLRAGWTPTLGLLLRSQLHRVVMDLRD